jgi:DNA-binding transcriptional regulator LsrR (DeoR family)
MKDASVTRRPSLRIRRKDLAVPVEFGGDLLVWAAWLYYEEQMTQEEVAERLGVSRATVINFLQEAREQGIVSISIGAEHLQSVRIARRLATRYGLASCLVVPRGHPDTPDYEQIGRAGARLLTQILGPDDVLGVSWGRTVLALSNALPAMSLPHVSVVQITGSAISTEDFSPEFCTSNIANRIGARCVNLHTPGIVSRPSVKVTLMAEPTVMQQFAVIRSCNKVLFGVAGVDARSMSLLSGYLTAEASRPYLERGAAGVLAGRFVGRDGGPVTGGLDDRMIGLTLDEIKQIPERICVAGGAGKVAAIDATLRGGYATVLVTDEAAATGLSELLDLRAVEPTAGTPA